MTDFPGLEKSETQATRQNSSPQNASQKISIAYSDIAALAFSGRDTAAGKSWEAWVRKYWERKAAGEKGIALEPEKLE